MRKRTGFDPDAWVEQAVRRGCGVTSCAVVRRKRFRGFDNFRERDFIHFRFRTRADMRRLVKNCYERRRDGRGEPLAGAPALYESDFDPLLDLFHTCAIESCGWVVAEGAAPGFRTPQRGNDGVVAVTVPFGRVRPPTEAERAGLPVFAPLETLFFDLECYSSNRDFPLARKTCARAANQIVDLVGRLAAPKSGGRGGGAEGRGLRRGRLARAFDPDDRDGRLEAQGGPRAPPPASALAACARDIAAMLLPAPGDVGADWRKHGRAGTARPWPGARTCASGAWCRAASRATPSCRSAPSSRASARPLRRAACSSSWGRATPSRPPTCASTRTRPRCSGASRTSCAKPTRT